MTPIDGATLKYVKSKYVKINGRTYWIRRWVWRLNESTEEIEAIACGHDCQVLGRMGKTLCWVSIPDFEKDKALNDAVWGGFQ